jgi:hypothetical protein
MTISKSLIGLCFAGAILVSASSAMMFSANPAQAIDLTPDSSGITLDPNPLPVTPDLTTPGPTTPDLILPNSPPVTCSGAVHGCNNPQPVPWELDGTATIFGSITGIGIGLGLKRLTSKKNINLKNS